MHRSLVLAALLSVVCCSSSSEPAWSVVKSQIIGRSYEDIVSCAGIPDTQSSVSVQTGAVLYRETISGGFTCDATLIIKDGRVTTVTQREIPSTDNTLHIPSDTVLWPNYSLCNKRFASCPWAK